MKVLIASMMPTHPINVGNRARIVQMCAALKSLGHEVHFAFVERESGDRPAMEEFLGTDRLHTCAYREMPSESGVINRAFRSACAAFSLDAAFTYGVDDWYDPHLDQFFRALNARFSFDAIIVEYVFLSRALECFDERVLKLIDTHDIFAERHKMYLDANLRPGWFSTTRRQELIGLRRADTILTIKQADCEVLSARLPGRRVMTLGHIVRTAPPIRDWTGREPWSLLFVGNDSPLNTIALLYLIEVVLPLVRATVPGARLLIAGSAGDAMAQTPCVERLGIVEDIADAYARTWIAVNPVTAGTGLAIKSIEALGFAVPLVTSRTGARGLDDSGRGAFISVPDHDDKAMAAAIVELLSNERGRTDLSVAACEFCREWNTAALEAVRAILVDAAPSGDGGSAPGQNTRI